MTEDVRWKQRFQNYERALAQLHEAVDLSHSRNLSRLEQQGLIQAFEYTHELAWKTLKDFFSDKGIQDLYGSKDVSRHAFQEGLIQDGDTWLDMIQSRNLSSHTYNQATADILAVRICTAYVQAFDRLRETLQRYA